MSLAFARSASAQTFNDPGFTAETVTTLAPFTPVGVVWAPDGRMFIWTKNGVVRVFKNGVLLQTPFIDLSAEVNTFDDRGMWGVAFHPDFANNGYVYLSYTYENASSPNSSAARTSRLVRVTANPSNPDVALAGSYTVILGSIGVPPCSSYPAGSDCIGADGGSHTIGTIRFGPDGKLLLGIGDGSDGDVLSLRAQDLNDWEGKILRMNDNGTAPGDNPFDDGTNSIRSKVWIYGVRNPFRYSVNAARNELYFGEVGWNTWEEVNRGVPGANFGWPCYEGNLPQPFFANFATCQSLPAGSVTQPILTYDRSVGAAAIGGAIYTGTTYPATYAGSYFFADYVGGWIRRVVFGANGNPTSFPFFATNVAAPVTVEQGPDGNLYYISFSTGQIRRIRFNGPSAVASANPTSGYSPLAVSFSSAGSVDPNGQPLSYSWNFGDGATSTAANPVHTYTAAGVTTFTATLTVRTSTNATSSATVRVTVGSLPPTPAIQAPADGTVVQPGQTIVYQGSATDPDQGLLPPSALSWTVLLHHNTHVHTFVGNNGSSTGSFVAEDHGTGTYSYEIVLTATDSSGLAASTSVNLPVSTDTTPPTAPSNLAATPVSSSQINLTWTASTDNGTVLGYQIERCAGAGCSNFAPLVTVGGTSHSDTGLAAATSYRYRVRATDASGNLSAYSSIATATTQAGPPPGSGLVAAYAFEEATGTTVTDASGNGNTGTINGATRTTGGKYGSALSFDGVNDLVAIAGSASLNVSAAMTLEAWIFPTAAQSGWRTILQREVDAYFLNASNSSGPLRPSGGAQLNGTVSWITGPSASPVNAWTHVALTYDGTALRLYVNGAQVSSAAASGSIQTTSSPLRIGGNVPYGEFFAGVIDEVRIYNRALSAAEIAIDRDTPVGTGGPAPDTTPPSTPAGLTANSTSSSAIALSWTASTDNVGVTGYQIERCTGTGCSSFAPLVTVSGTSHSDTGLAAATSYSYRVRATDAAGNLSAYSSIVTAATPVGPPPGSGLVAAYAFEEASGATVTDASGNGNTGTINGATRTTGGKYGSALSFDGVNDLVEIAGSASLNVSTAMTLEAWIFPTVQQSGWRTILQREVDAYFLNASNSSGPLRPSGGAHLNGDVSWISGPSLSPVSAWTHVALTYDGSALRLYVNGTQVATAAASGSIQTTSSPLRIGGNVPYGEFFTGAIDEVRIYNRALSAAEIVTDRDTPIGGGGPTQDTAPPSAPASLTATATGATAIALAWTASTDNVGVTGYQIERCTGAGCSNFAPLATVSGTSHNDTGLTAASTYTYRVRATDAAGNLSGYSATAAATTPSTPDTTPPSAPASLTATAASATAINLSWAASTDNVGVTGYQIERCTGAGCSNFALLATVSGTIHNDIGLTAATTYSYRVRARDAVGNLSGYSSTATATTQAAPPQGSGLVAAYAFEEASGTSVTDASGNANTGTINGATRTTGGKYGSALSFDGINDLVEIAGSASLNVSAAMTLEAWIFPTAAQSGWRTILQREVDAYFLNASNGSGPLHPSGGAELNGTVAWIGGPAASPVSAWTHLALTYDGAALRLYVNGTQVATAAASGSIQTTSSPLRIGGNVPYGEFFAGVIDEVRIYNRALSAAEIVTDRDTPISGGAPAPDTTAPAAPSGLTATATASNSIALSWTASTDNVGVTGYQIERCAGSGCSNFAPLVTVSGTTLTDTGLTAATSYSYRVRAADAAGNLSGYSSAATAATPGAADTAPPTAPSGLTASATGRTSIALSWTASTDNVGVAGYRIERCAGQNCTNFALVATATGTAYNDTGLTPATRYRYRVRAVDAAGNLSAYSSTAQASTRR